MSDNPTTADDVLRNMGELLASFKGKDAKLGELILSTMISKIMLDMIKNPSLKDKLNDKMFAEGFQYGMNMGFDISTRIIDEEMKDQK